MDTETKSARFGQFSLRELYELNQELQQELRGRQQKQAEKEYHGGEQASTGGAVAQAPTPYRPHELTLDNVEDAFLYHSWDRDQTNQGDAVREGLIVAARAILRNVPPCPDRSSAIRKIREARMDANSGITHRGRY